jgi:hypothetical protein
MALGRVFLSDIIALKRRGLLDGCRRVVEIGTQQVNNRMIASPEFDEVIALFGGTKPLLTPVGAPRIEPNSPLGRLLWSALGLQSESIDIEGGDIRIDLNKGRVPFRYRGAFDIAINAGTTEHIANQECDFAVIRGLVRTGALIYHQVPATGYIDHGFFSYPLSFSINWLSRTITKLCTWSWRRMESLNCRNICAQWGFRSAFCARVLPSSWSVGGVENSQCLPTAGLTRRGSTD